VSPVIESLIREQQLDADQQLLVGMGGGIGALLPSVAERLRLPFELAKDAEIISSIGAAMAMVREVVERANPDPSSEDIAELRAETLQAIGRLGADPKSVDITVEMDRQTGRIRAIATGAAALRGPDRRRSIDEPLARRIAARSLHRSEDEVALIAATAGAFVFTARTGSGHSLRVVDWHGTMRLQRSNALVRETTVEGWQDAFRSMDLFGPEDGGDTFFGAVLLYGEHMVDLSGVGSLSSAVKIVKSEFADTSGSTPLILIGFARPGR
jgi:hypothetical protein